MPALKQADSQCVRPCNEKAALWGPSITKQRRNEDKLTLVCQRLPPPPMEGGQSAKKNTLEVYFEYRRETERNFTTGLQNKEGFSTANGRLQTRLGAAYVNVCGISAPEGAVPCSMRPSHVVRGPGGVQGINWPRHLVTVKVQIQRSTWCKYPLTHTRARTEDTHTHTHTHTRCSALVGTTSHACIRWSHVACPTFQSKNKYNYYIRLRHSSS